MPHIRSPGKTRGLHGVKMVISDDHKGTIQAVLSTLVYMCCLAIMPGTLHEECDEDNGKTALAGGVL